MTTATRLAALLRDGAGIDLPVRLRLWDGSETGPRDGPVLVLRNRRALRRLLWAPGELGLARAYVTGDLDVEGDLGAAEHYGVHATGITLSGEQRVHRSQGGPAGSAGQS